MKPKISISSKLLPKYGEILLGIGALILSNIETLYENEEAREKLKYYLKNDAMKKHDLLAVSLSEELQEIVMEYTGIRINIAAIVDNVDNPPDKINIYIADFFNTSIWPIIVNKYIDNINLDVKAIATTINVKRNVFINIYGSVDHDTFFKEFKEFLNMNMIIISKAEVKENEDMLVGLVIPIPPRSKFDFRGND